MKKFYIMRTIFTSLILLVIITSNVLSQEEREPKISGYIQENSTSFSETVIYLRSAVGYSREGYIVFGVDDASVITSAILRLYVSDVQKNDTTEIDFSAGANNQVSGMTWDSRPTDLEDIGTVKLAVDYDSIDLDMTDYYNDLINSDVDSFTIRLISETTNAFAQFISVASSLTDKHPVLIITTNCHSSSQKIDTVVCSGVNPVLAGEARTEDGLYYDTLTTDCGSDSVLIYNLTILDNDTTVEEATICEGESYEGYTETGVYYYSVTSTDGLCKQVFELHLTVNDLPEVNLGDDIEISEGESITLSVASGYESYIWSDGTTGESIIVSDESFSDGDEIYVVVSNSNGCTNSDTVLLTITENEIKPAYDAFVKEYDDSYNNTTALEVKYDQYGDLDNPGVEPFWSRESYLAFDLSDLDQEIKDVKLQLYLYNVTFITPTPDDPIPVDISIAKGLYDESMIWSTKPSSNEYSIAATVSITEDDVDSLILFDINDYLQNNILSDTNQFSIKISSNSDENSSMVKFRSLEYTNEAMQPRLVYSTETSSAVEVPASNMNSSFEVFPNPVSNNLNIRTSLDNPEVIIRDITGRKYIHIQNVDNVIDVSALPNGLYLITIRDNINVVTKRLIKQ